MWSGVFGSQIEFYLYIFSKYYFKRSLATASRILERVDEREIGRYEFVWVGSLTRFKWG